jgi:MFS family permease
VTELTESTESTATPRVAPLYAAGFVTAFGAHSVAAGLGATGEDIGLTLLRIGVLLALYDVAEVILKPIFGSLSDRIGARPVILGGLIAFAAFSLLGLGAAEPLILAAARLGQGAAAAAFSPAASATVARLAGPGRSGRYFGRYGSWKALGYTLGPLLGAGLIALGGLPLLFAGLSLLAAVTTIWVAVALAPIAPLPRPRYTVLDLARQSVERSFLLPTLVLAASTAALGAAVGFLPALAGREGAGVLGSIAVVSVLALASAIVQPRIGALRDRGVLSDPAGMVVGLLLIATGIALAAAVPSIAALYVAGLVIGVGIGVTTPFAFASLASSIPPERMGRTMGSAELGRELGDTAGPLLVGGIATFTGLPIGLTCLGIAVLAIAGVATRVGR